MTETEPEGNRRKDNYQSSNPLQNFKTVNKNSTFGTTKEVITEKTLNHLSMCLNQVRDRDL